MNLEDYVRDGATKEFHAQLNPEVWTTYHDGQASHAALMVEDAVRRAPLPANAVDRLDLGGGHWPYSFSFCARYPTFLSEWW